MGVAEADACFALIADKDGFQQHLSQNRHAQGISESKTPRK